MGRAKLRMELIPKEKTRITTYRKRKRGKTGKRTYNLNDFFQDRRKKNEEELMKARKKNMEAKYSTWFDALNSLPEHQLRQFAAKLEQREHDARTRLEFKKRNMNIISPYTAGLDLGLGLGKPDPELNHRHMLMNRELMAAYGYPSVDYGRNVTLADRVFFAELNEVLPRELAEDGSSGVEVRVTRMRIEIIINVPVPKMFLVKFINLACYGVLRFVVENGAKGARYVDK
nr:agamous-like MADS-box protein AGL82 [Tanacetum cinerariifolium]